MCDHCRLTPGETARVDQAAALFRDGLDRLITQACRSLDKGDTAVHTAAGVAMALAATTSPPQMATLLGFAIVRLAEQQRADHVPAKPHNATTPPSTQEDL